MTPRCRTALVSWGVAVTAPVVALAVRMVLLPLMGEHAPLMLFSVAIAVAGWVGGLWPGLAATAVSLALVDFFFIAPIHSFAIPDAPTAVRLLVLAICGGIISAMGEASRRATARLHEQAESLRESAEEFRAMFTRSSVGKAEADPLTGRFLRVNPAFCRLMGYSEEELLQRTLVEITHPEDRAITIEGNERLLRGEMPEFQIDKRYLRPDGAVVWVHLTANVIHDRTDKPLRTMAVLQDITARKEAEQALRDRERRLRTFFESDMVGTMYWTIDGGITDANNRFLAITGYSREDLTAGRVDWAHMTPEAYRELDDKAIEDLRNTGVDTPYEKEFMRKDGTRVPVIIGAAMLDESRHEGVAFILDITERKRVEEALAEAKAVLERTNAELEDRVERRTAELRETIAQLEGFSYSLTHDLRAPLRTMTSFASLLQEDYGGKLGPEADDYLRRITDAARRMDHLIVDVLQYSTLSREDLPLGKVDALSLVSDIIEQYPAIAQHREHIHIENGCADPHVRANLAALTQVFSNLLTNALKFVPPGRTPEVRVRCEDQENGWLRISVIDNGLGISPEHQDKIWGVFHRLHSVSGYPGTGIGLSIVKKAVQRMGGSLGLESEVGRGSCFWIALPRIDL